MIAIRLKAMRHETKRLRPMRLSTKLALLTVSLFLVFFAAMALGQLLMTASGLLQDIDSYAESSFTDAGERLMLHGYLHDSELPAGTTQSTLTEEQRQAAMASLAASFESQTYIDALNGRNLFVVMISHMFDEPAKRNIDYLSDLPVKLVNEAPESVGDRKLLINSVRNWDRNLSWLPVPEKFTPTNGMGSLTFAVSERQNTVTRYDGSKTYLRVIVFYNPLRLALATLWRSWLLYLAIAVILMLFFAWLIRRLVAKPIMELSQTAHLMAGRHIVEDSTFAKRSDEIGILANSLNGLANDLNRTISQLEVSNRDLANANIRLSHEMERERALDQNRRAFIAGASHELKTPLALISGHAESLMHDIDPEKRQHHAERIMNAALRMGRLVKDLMLSARLEDPACALNVSRFSLSRLAKDTAADFSQAIADKKLAFTEKLIPETDAIVEADEERIRQVILNLLSNAVRHTPGCGSLTIGIERVDGCIRLFVENEGDAIPENELSKIWDLFYRPDASSSADNGGSGIGLAVVRTILEQHHADYGAENTSTGVCFYFVLPTVQWE